MENAKNDVNGMTATVTTVASECPPVETAVSGTVQTHVEPVPTMSGNQKGLTFTNTKRQSSAKRPCQHCGCEMVVKRPSKRFCGAACRRAAWLQSNPEKAAVLAANDKARLRAHLENKGLVWVEQAA